MCHSNERAVQVLLELGIELGQPEAAADGKTALIIVHRCNTAWWTAAAEQPGKSAVWDQWGKHLWSEVTARQVLAIERALRSSWAAGCQWLLHIDVDEALCCGGLQPTRPPQQNGAEVNDRMTRDNDAERGEVGQPHQDASLEALAATAGAAEQFFAGLPPALDQVTFMNHEAAPESAVIADWFKEVTLFKRNPSAGGDKRHFVAYTNGKSAVRLAEGVIPAGPHRFASIPPARRLQSIAVSDDYENSISADGDGEDQH